LRVKGRRHERTRPCHMHRPARVVDASSSVNRSSPSPTPWSSTLDLRIIMPSSETSSSLTSKGVHPHEREDQEAQLGRHKHRDLLPTPNVAPRDVVMHATANAISAIAKTIATTSAASTEPTDTLATPYQYAAAEIRPAVAQRRVRHRRHRRKWRGSPAPGHMLAWSIVSDRRDWRVAWIECARRSPRTRGPAGVPPDPRGMDCPRSVPPSAVP